MSGSSVNIPTCKRIDGTYIYLQARSAFKELPAEIRVMIYRYLLHCSYVDRRVVQRHQKGRATARQPCPERYQFTLAILRANRAICREACGVLYRENEWVLFGETDDLLRQDLRDVSFPMIRLKGIKNNGHLNSRLAVGLKVRIEYQGTAQKALFWFLVSLTNAAKVSQFMLTRT